MSLNRREPSMRWSSRMHGCVWSFMLVAVLGLAVASAGGAIQRPKAGYWSGSLGRRGVAEVELLVRPDGRYMLRLNTRIIDAAGRRVETHPTTKVFCPPARSCGRQGLGFGFSFSWTSSTTMSGTWWLDPRVYHDYRIPKGENRMHARWLARPRLRIQPSTVAAGRTVTVTGSGFIPRERVLVGGGNNPIFAIERGRALYADRSGHFSRRVQIIPGQNPGTYPDVYLYQRNCLTTCWVRGSARMVITPFVPAASGSSRSSSSLTEAGPGSAGRAG